MVEKFARGRSSEIFKLEDGKVLKLFFKDYPKVDAEREFKNSKIAFNEGCTKTNVYEMVSKDGRFGFTMDFIDGISQNDMPGKNPFYLFKGGKDLAICHSIVHSKKNHNLEDVRVAAYKMLDEKPFIELDNNLKIRIKKYLTRLPEDDTIIHLDFHTGNVLVNRKTKELNVIDWMTAERGNRAIEYAMMEFLFSEAELFPEASKLQLKLFSAVRKMIGKQYYKKYQKLMPISKEEVDKYRIVALIVRRSWNIEFEKEYLLKTIKELAEKYC